MKVNGAAVRAIREAQRRLQLEVAERAGVDPGHLARIELGTKGATAEKIAALAGALGVPVAAISYPDPVPLATLRRAARVLAEIEAHL